MRMRFGRLFSLYFRYSIKVGAACLMAYALSYAMGSHYAVWAVVSTIIAMQVNVAESLQAGINRVAGTVLGAVVGVVLLVTLPKDPYIFGAAIVGISMICAYLSRYGVRWSLASIAAVIVLLSGASLLPEGYDAAVSFGLMRVAEIVIGVGSAFAVGLLLWPVRLLDTLRADLGLQFHECARLTDSLIGSFLKDQQSLPTDLLEDIEARVWSNHERLDKTRKHESFIFRYDHGIMEAQVVTLDRTVEYLRTMLEALNDYEDEPGVMPLTPEMRSLADAVMAALRHIGGDNPTVPAPDLVRRLTIGIGTAENRLADLRLHSSASAYPLHKVL